MDGNTYVVEEWQSVLGYLRSRFPMYHHSNFFFRDIQYGILSMMEERGTRVRYPEAENLARAFAERLEKENVFVPVDRQTWVVNYPEFKTPVVGRTAAAAKPAGPAARTADAQQSAPRPAATPTQPTTSQGSPPPDHEPGTEA